MEQKIVEVVVGLPLAGPFDYALPAELVGRVRPGARVYVPFRQGRTVGYVVGLKVQSDFAHLKTVHELLDEEAPALDEMMLALTRKMADYYACSWGEAIETSLPISLRKKKTLAVSAVPSTISSPTGEPLRRCFCAAEPVAWEVSVAAVKEMRRAGRGVIYLVPEAVQAEETGERLKGLLGEPVVVWDREMSASAQLTAWTQLKSGQVAVAVGTRSCVFAPVANLGLLVVQDDDNLSYKQEQSPFYQLRELALMRADLQRSAMLFVGPAPSAELWSLGDTGAVKREVGPASPVADFQILNLNDFKPYANTAITVPLQTAMYATLEQKEKVLLYLNRRGFSLGTRCNQCGFTMKCQRCGVTLSYLYSQQKLVCHLCQSSTELPKFCPHCQGSYLRSWGVGIEKLESELTRFFPQAKVARYDRDSAELPRRADIIVATQAVVRDLALLAVSLVGVLEFDAELNRFDFRGGQRAFGLLLRLRYAVRKKVIVQTYQPHHYVLQAAGKMALEKFYQEELVTRAEAGFPPYKHLLEICLRSPTEEEAFTQAGLLNEALQRASLGDGVEVMEPQAAHQAKLRDQYRFVVMVKVPAVESSLEKILPLLHGLKKKRNVIVTVNVDP